MELEASRPTLGKCPSLTSISPSSTMEMLPKSERTAPARRTRALSTHHSLEVGADGTVLARGGSALLEEGKCFIAHLGTGSDWGSELATARVVALPHSAGACIEVATGDLHSLFLCDGGVYSCGGGWEGPLGHGNEASTSVPRPLAALAHVKVERVAAGGAHSLAVAEGRLWSWGWSRYGQCGHGDDAVKLLTPRCIDGLQGIVQVSSRAAPFLAGEPPGHPSDECRLCTRWRRRWRQDVPTRSPCAQMARSSRLARPQPDSVAMATRETRRRPYGVPRACRHSRGSPSGTCSLRRTRPPRSSRALRACASSIGGARRHRSRRPCLRSPSAPVQRGMGRSAPPRSSPVQARSQSGGSGRPLPARETRRPSRANAPLDSLGGSSHTEAWRPSDAVGGPWIVSYPFHGYLSHRKCPDSYARRGAATGNLTPHTATRRSSNAFY